MKTIILKSIRYENFKGFSAFEFNPTGSITDVFGANATGKTSIYDGFLWCIFGKDSIGQTGFSIKPIDRETGEEVHNLRTSVETVLEIDGTPLVLKKCYQEKWTKKRGQSKQEFGGHTVDHFVNEVPCKKKEFDAAVSDMIDESVFKILTNPKHFNEALPCAERRKILIGLCGDITHDDISQQEPSLAAVDKILAVHSPDDFRLVAAERRKEINRELAQIPIRIDELKKAMDETPVEDAGSIDGKIEHLKSKRAALQKELTTIQAGGQLASLNKRKLEIENELQKEQQYWQKVQYARAQKVRENIAGCGENIRGLESGIKEAVAGGTALQKQIATIDADLISYREQWKTISAQAFIVAENCPTCGQTMPDEKVELAREQFNLEKSRKLAEINTNGKARKAEKETAGKAMAEANARIQAMRTAIENWNGLKSDAEKQLSNIESETFGIPADKADILETIVSKIINESDGKDSGETARLESEITAIDPQIEAAQALATRIEMSKNTSARIEKLKKDEKALAAALEKTEGDLAMVQDYIRARDRLYEDRINAKFKTIKWRLFEEQINGGMKDVCECLDKGVPYSSMNNAARITAGLEIADVLSEHYGILAVCFLDNAESVCLYPDTRFQIIKLIVSPEHKTLTIGV